MAIPRIEQEAYHPAAASEPGAARLAAPAGRTVSGRAICIGAVLVPLNAFWVVKVERVMYGPYPSTISLFANTVFVLFLLVALNAAMRRGAPRWAFTQGELLTIYTMVAISTGLAGLDAVPMLSEMIPEGGWFGRMPRNSDWSSFLASIPSWWSVTDPKVLSGHFLGNTTLYRWDVLRAWAVPALAWGGFTILLLLVAYAICVLVRRQWADRERLTFPIIWLPMEMTDGGTGRALFRSRLMWGGFALAATINLWNGIALLYPSLPSIPVGLVDLQVYFTAKPWSAIDWLPTTLYPLVIGLGYLLPLDLLFSCWFFFLLWKAQRVVAGIYAWDVSPDVPYTKEQGFGAILGLFAFYVWSGRHAYAEILKRSWRGKRSDPEHREGLDERTALLLVVGGTAGLILFCRAAGVAWWVAAAFFAIYLPTLVVITRIRAELGSPVHDFHFMGPDNMLTRALGTTAFSRADLAFFTYSFAFTRAHRGDVMPVALEGLQMARLRRLNSRRMFAAIVIATVLGTFGTLWGFEHQAYAMGASSRFASGHGMSDQAFERLNNWVNGGLDKRPNIPAVTAVCAGFVSTLVLLFLRLRFFGFPLHPIGYAVSSSWSIHLVWLPLFIAWVFKGLALRYGGLPAYRRWLPFFLGLILGDCVMGSIWAFLSLVLNVRTYNFFGA